MQIQSEKIPQYLKANGQFCNWKYELRNGNQTKVPYMPGTTRRASVSDPATFTAFETAASATGYDGIGVRVCDRIVGIDLDHCIVDGKPLPWAQKIVDRFHATYIEVSPSGTGIRIFCLLPDGFTYDIQTYYIKKGNIEVYIPGHTNRFLTITGNALTDTDVVEVADDGVDRINELEEIIGISGDETACLYLTKWLHQSVALALNDETDPYGGDGVLVIQNPQGAGKTLLFSKLAMHSDWFAEGTSIDTDKKDSVIQATGCWIAELGELDSTLKREQSALKAFITSRTDTYRQPYARVATKKPRRTSFCATVNPSEFLNDETGSRRWWVISPRRIDVDRLKALPREWVQQLWAQIYTQYYLPNPQGFRLTEEERKRLTADNERYSKPLPGEPEIMDKLEWSSPAKHWKWYKVTQVRDLLNLKPLTTAQVGRALTRISTRDERVQTKAPGNVKQYLLPPMCRGAGYYHSVEDFFPPLSEDTDLSA